MSAIGRGRQGRARAWPILGLGLAACSGGGDSAVGTEGLGGGAGTSFGVGGGSPSGGTGGGVGSDAGAPSSLPEALDPPGPGPQPDLDGQVAIMGPYLLVSERQASSLVPTALEVLEVESGVRHGANPLGQYLAYVTLSPDRGVFLFSGANAAEVGGPQILRLLDDGFVPARALSGYTEDLPGALSSWRWTADSRFVAAWRGSSVGEGIDVIDVATGSRWGGVSVQETGFIDDFTGNGYQLPYGEGPYEAREYGLLWVTDEGVSAPLHLPVGSLGTAVADDGSVFVIDRSGEPRLLRIPPGSAGPIELAALPEGQIPLAELLPDPGGQSLVLVTQDAAEHSHLYRVFVDGTTPQPIGSQSGDAFFGPAVSADGRWLLQRYLGDGERSVELISRQDGVGIRVATLPDTGLDADVLAAHFYYQSEGEPLHLVGVEGGAPVNFEVADSGPAKCLRLNQPFAAATRLVVGVGAEASRATGLALIDVGSPLPQRITTITPDQPEATLSCPVWSKDGGSFVYTEDVAGGPTLVRRIVWDDAGPQPPTLVHETSLELTIYALR